MIVEVVLTIRADRKILISVTRENPVGRHGTIVEFDLPSFIHSDMHEKLIGRYRLERDYPHPECEE